MVTWLQRLPLCQRRRRLPRCTNVYFIPKNTFFFYTSFAGVNAAPGRAPDGARRHPSTRGHDVEGCVLLQVADHETNDGMRWTEWNRKKKKCMHHGYNYGQPRRAWTWSKTSGMRLDATSPVRMRELHRTDDGHNIRRSAGTLFFFFIRRANIRMELTSEEVREHLVSE